MESSLHLQTRFIRTPGHVLWVDQLSSNVSINDERNILETNTTTMAQHYMDDVLIGNEGDREDLTQKGIVVLDKMEENDLFVKPEKSEFFVTDVNFLGYRLKDGKLSMEDQKVSGIADWPPPENVSQLRSFFGFCNFYRRFIDHYADLCAPLNKLLRKTIVWDWTPRRHESFKRSKQHS
jgi:hypothetical protein